MNRSVLRLLLDYFRRTLGVWPLIVIVHLIQVTSFWATHVDRLPLLGVLIASLAYFAAFESPSAVLRTLPLTRADVALFRWWASIGSPGIVIFLCTAVAWLASADNGWPHPLQSEVTRDALASWAVLTVLASLPLPTRAPEKKSGAFTFVWVTLLAAAFYGLPFGLLPEPVLTIFIALAVALSLVSYVRAWQGRPTVLPVSAFTRRQQKQGPKTRSVGGFLRGWSLLATDAARATALLALIALAAVSVSRRLYPILDGTVPLVWIFVAAVAVAGCLLSRRWMQAVRLLRILPIGAHRLTLVLYGLLILPGLFACTVATVAWHLSPHLGVDVPLYLFIAFIVSPVTLVPWQQSRYTSGPVVNSAQQWAPVLLQCAWPLWTGALSSYRGPHVMPTLLLVPLVIIAMACGIFGYFALFTGIRSTFGFERSGGPLGVAS